MHGWHTLESANCAPHVLMQSCTPGVQRASCRWGVQYSFDTDISQSHCPWLVPLGLLQPPITESFVEAFLPTVGLMLPPSSLHVQGPTSTIMPASIHVGEDPVDLSTITRPLSCSLHLTSSSGEGGVLHDGTPVGDPSSSLPAVLIFFQPSEMEQQPIRGHGGLFKVACGPFIFILMGSLFGIGVFLEKWQRSGAESCIFWRERTGSSKRWWRSR